ncbi:hypothetical protein Nepgr_016507 [Nepenthes gracilis]|uniref:Cyclin-like domain-containing protein n=1 Tax=Nepenthes gracilis TaxID=150966 RepID=A0AAD3SQG8_NEPGR|nr:hypothetical protein Nepgr_016507 [Nepenthes gracilis]
MEETFDCKALKLPSDENGDVCFDQLDDGGANDDDDQNHQKFNNQSPCYATIRSESLIRIPIASEESFFLMIESEGKCLPSDDYARRLRSGKLGLSVRTEALEWIWKAHNHYGFGASSFCLSMNYLDRFLSVREVPKGKPWAMQLLALACLSIAAKMEETLVPPSMELQVGDPKFLFEAKTIQRMELMVLGTLDWKMRALTPCSFIEHFLMKISDENPLSSAVIDRSTRLIVSTIKDIDFLEFKPYQIAAAVAISVSGDRQTEDIDEAFSSSAYFEKEKVMKCVQLIKDLSLISSSVANVGSGSGQSVPQSPVGVLDAARFIYKSD